ncbi:kinase-like domain-containing protein [Thelephora terrestris]|uniref:Kinase-like domain-containing protein n=1 Tax=Thelephora terrestris TaxID=56493 RepID=A0A9P6H7I6_9AGAM|nr:kinase-like domain-containing protein [Thelephora terrestris]
MRTTILSRHPLSPLAVVANVKLRDIAKCLERSDDAQKFIDVMDQALETIDFAPRVRNKCVKSLYKMCARHTLLPSSLRFELPGGPMGEVKYRCGSADVLKRECGGREVAIKALWPRSDLSLETMTNRFCKEVITWKSLRHPNILPLQGATMTGNRFAMVSEWMTNGNIKEYTAAHQDTNRFALLVDVAKGLIHMHGRGMIHGDLKGANILVDRDGRACLADFGLLTIASDATNTPSSNSFLEGGTCRWMGPELFNPEKFGLKDGRPTRSSDCYALGMVVYEVLSGRVPFHRYGDYAVVAKVSEGERPERPQGARGAFFGNDIWNLLQSCWMPSPGNRPKIKDVLRRLEDVSRSWTPPPQTITDLPIETAATWEPESSTEESIDGCGFSSTSEMNSPQLSQRHSLEAPSYHVLGAAVRSPGGSGRSTQSLDGQPSSGSQSMETLLRRRSTCTCQEALPQCHTLDEFQAIGAEGCEWQDRALRVFTEKGCHGDLAMRKTRESPGGAEHLRALVQTMLEWMDVQKALNAMPFYYY